MKTCLLVFMLGLISTQHIPASRHDYKLNERYYLTYKYSTTTRPVTPRPDPDSFFLGFFPIWSAILIGLTGFCLFVSLIGLCCWLIGLNNPRRVMKEQNNKYKKQLQKEQEMQQEYLEDQYYDDISMRMIDTIDKHGPNLFADAKLVTEFDYESKIYMEKKKKFMRDHL
ncbi:unnamed protein product [Brachionus calyciflorus]|uniref:Uncharacterized protein n=1 Tax=Brachionus calyciflorus TaxID=104777 RepID=A0A813PP35_9BILA|nr:unnamed protein product [Brachionus calyciflorus]